MCDRGHDPAENAGTVKISLFQNSSSKNFNILWRAHHVFDWLKASDTAVTEVSPKHLFLLVLNKLVCRNHD